MMHGQKNIKLHLLLRKS